MISANAVGQSVPTHEMYVRYGTPQDLVASLQAWEKGKAWGTEPEDENFFISRVPVKQRFLPSAPANTKLNDTNAKNFCWCSPTGEMTKKWGALPRYNFDGDNFNLWQYVKYHSNWSNGWWRVPGAFNDVAHKNGVKTGCTYFIDWGAAVNAFSEPGKTLYDLAEKDSKGEFVNAEKLVDFLHYYGIDGLTFNPEGHWGFTVYSRFIPFLAKCHEIAKKKGYEFRVDWYAFVLNNGWLSDNGCKLDNNNDAWFHHTLSNQPVTDMYFLNYNWTGEDLATSVATAVQHGRSSFDVYAGFDQQGRGYGKRGNSGWEDLMKYPVSIVVWGAHDRSQLYAASTEGGQSDYAVQNEYQKKQEMLFSGGNRNVLQLPPINTGNTTASFSDLKTWHGYAAAVREQSTLSEVPFVTRFNLGNGRFMNDEGRTTWAHKWYNIGMQDLLPTWRWWIDKGDGKTVPSPSIKADFTYDDAWFGGSCLKLHGATQRSDIRLFATRWNVTAADDQIRLVYKLTHGTNSHLELMVAKEGAEPVFTTKPVADGEQGQWNTLTLKAGDFGLKAGDVIGTIGLSAKDTPDNFEVLLGELAYTPSGFAETPVTPVIKTIKVLKRLYNRVDFKVIFDMPWSGERPADRANSPIYNEEVGAWYYEIWTKQGAKENLLTTTTSWAAYVVEAPLLIDDPTFQIGVRAVGRDGRTKSPITWSEKQTSPLQMIETLTIDKEIIKPEEEFTIGFEDPNHPKANINIYNALTGDLVKSAIATRALKTALPKAGSYDVEVVQGEQRTMNRSLILVSPETTGRLPRINTLQADKPTAPAGETRQITADIEKGVEHDGKPCTVSQSLYMQEPYQFTVDAAVIDSHANNSFALWFKVEKFEHASLGTLLMTKVNRNYPGTWTEKVWGQMWTAIRPAHYAQNNNINRDNAANEISISFDGPRAGTPNYEHNNDVDGLTDGYSLLPNTWYHIAVVKNGKNDQRLYLNGKKVIECPGRGTAPKDWKGAHFYVGGSMVNLASFTGWVDEVQIWSKSLSDEEVQQAMMGYAVAPEHLDGYFTFETTQTDADGNIYFPNLGKNADKVPGGYMTIGKSENNINIDHKQNRLTTALGVPTITGTLPINYESSKWLLEGAVVNNADDTKASATYKKEGTYPISIIATNSWGSTTKTINDYIVVTEAPAGIEQTELAEDFTIYPQTFDEKTHILFRQAGNYAVRVFAADGRLVADEIYNADRDEVAEINFNAPAGTYVVTVSKDGKCRKSFKIRKH